MPSKYLNDARTGELIQKIYTADRAVATECKSYTDTNYLPLAGGTLTGAVNGVTPTAGDESTKLATTEYVREEVRQHSGIPIGHIYFSVNPNIPQGSLPLFGGEFSRETYSDLWAWVQQQAGYCKTEAEWQALATNNNNNVPYYSDGDGSTTFRVPSMRCWVKGADGTVVEVGSYLAAGLPNITGMVRPLDGISNVGSSYSGAFTTTSLDNPSRTLQSGNLGNSVREVNFNASLSNPIYGNASTVQPESIVGLWLVKAYGTIEDTGQIDEQQYIDDRIAALPNTFLPLAGGTMSGVLRGADGNKMFAIQNSSENSDGYIIVDGGKGYADGASISIYGKNGTYGGAIFLDTFDGTNRKILSAYPNGSLTWDNKQLERVNAIGTNYIRYESGLQICWGGIDTSTSGATVTFSVAFKDNSYEVVNSTNANAVSWQGSWTSTSIKLFRSTTGRVYWIAIGFWK